MLSILLLSKTKGVHYSTSNFDRGDIQMAYLISIELSYRRHTDIQAQIYTQTNQISSKYILNVHIRKMHKNYSWCDWCSPIKKSIDDKNLDFHNKERFPMNHLFLKHYFNRIYSLPSISEINTSTTMKKIIAWILF